MKTLMLAVVFAATATLSVAAMAAQPVNNATPNATGTAHYEWQYHYVGHHARYEGYWALVR
jgi:hypothetical protein